MLMLFSLEQGFFLGRGRQGTPLVSEDENLVKREHRRIIRSRASRPKMSHKSS